ncbi:MAG: inverse autotransporter beta domain-containing protein [Legionellales bacterium]|nr:inverse autotransporter beta domain-containing protein [Legionellales bacterium]
MNKKSLSIYLISLTLFCSLSCAKYDDQIEIFYKAGKRHIGRLSMLLPLKQRSNQLIFLNSIMMHDSNSASEGNLGLGYRLLSKNQIFGSYLYYDIRRTSNKNLVNQLTVGFEYMRKVFEFRVNGYLPIFKRKFILNKTVLNNELTHDNSNIYLESSVTTTIERAFHGFDGEIGFTSKKIKTNIFAGGYLFKADSISMPGIQARIEYKPIDWLTVSGEVKRDKIRKTEFYGGFSVRINMGDSNNSPYTLNSKMTQMPIRDVDIIDSTKIEKNIQEKSSFRLVRNKADLDKAISDKAKLIAIVEDIDFAGATVTYGAYDNPIKDTKILGMKLSIDSNNNITGFDFFQRKLSNYIIPARNPAAPNTNIKGYGLAEVGLGLFQKIENSEIAHFIINSWTSNDYGSAGLIGHAVNSEIKNITNLKPISGDYNAGVIVYATNKTIISNCINRKDIIGDGYNAGIAIISSDSFILGNSNYGGLLSEYSSGVLQGAYGDSYVFGNTNYGIIKKSNCAGVIIDLSNKSIAKNNINKGDIYGYHNGGVIVDITRKAIAEYNINEGNIYGYNNGGVIYSSSGESVVMRCINKGNIYKFNNGGIINNSSGTSIIKHNSSKADVYGNMNGLIFYVSRGSAEIIENTGEGIIFGTRNAGCGVSVYSTGKVSNNKFEGEIAGNKNSSLLIELMANNGIVINNISNAKINGKDHRSTWHLINASPDFNPTNTGNIANHVVASKSKLPSYSNRKFSLLRKIQIGTESDIVNQEVEAILNPSGITGGALPNGGVSPIDDAIRHKLYNITKRDIRSYNISGGIEKKDFIVTKGDQTKAKFIIWGKVPSYDNTNINLSKNRLESFVQDALRFAGQNRISSIALPAIGTGGGGYPLDASANTMVNAINQIQTKFGYDINVTLVAFNNAQRLAYQNAIDLLQ